MKKQSNLFFKKVTANEILALRHEILRPGYPIETAMFDGDNEPETYHFACYLPDDENVPVCCVSYMKNEVNKKPAFQLRGMATKANLQNQGLGKRLTNFAENIIVSNTGLRLVWCNARLEAVGFYEKQGWEKVSNVFDIENVGPHIKMVKEI